MHEKLQPSLSSVGSIEFRSFATIGIRWQTYNPHSTGSFIRLTFSLYCLIVIGVLVFYCCCFFFCLTAHFFLSLFCKNVCYIEIHFTSSTTQMQGLKYWLVNWQCQARVGPWQAKSSTRWSHGQMMQTIILKQIPKSVNLRYFCPFVKMQSRSLIAYYKRISSLLFQFFDRSENESWLSKNLSDQSSCPATIWKLVWAL